MLITLFYLFGLSQSFCLFNQLHVGNATRTLHSPTILAPRPGYWQGCLSLPGRHSFAVAVGTGGLETTRAFQNDFSNLNSEFNDTLGNA